MSDRKESDRRYRESVKVVKEELAHLQEEKSEWEAEKKLIYTTLQPGVNDLIDKYNELLKYVFVSGDDEINNDMIKSYRVNFIKLPDIEITDEAVANIGDTHKDEDAKVSQKTNDDEATPNETIEHPLPDEAPDEDDLEMVNDEIISSVDGLDDLDEDERNERMRHSGHYDMPNRYSPERPHVRPFVSFVDLDTKEEQIKRCLQMGHLAEVPEQFQKAVFQADPTLEQEWEDYQQTIFGGKLNLH
ncbi:MAG: hypothetical protein M1483_08560 [Actinobacteria bacterium]|nr:hypothetical protein [Actinomycetota bacterium]MCL6105653.1 hypothetical protein [Actinomycetota bacterium]